MPRAPRLVVGLGNPAAGDDGVGRRLAERLALDARVPGGVEVLCGGADVLRLARHLDGRRELLLVDACLGLAPGALELVDHAALAARQDGRAHAHHVSAVDAIELLLSVGELRVSRVRWALVGVNGSDVRAGDGLSPALTTTLPGLVDRVLAAIAPER